MGERNYKTSLDLYKTLTDPVRFIEELCLVPYPGKGGIKIKLDPYAKRFLHDRTTLRFVLKSRRVGFSTLFSLEAFHRSIMYDETMSFFVSNKEDQSCEMLRVARYAAYNLPKPFSIDVTKDRETKLEFSNGSRIIALSSSSDASRGLTGNAYLDEWASIPNADDIWMASSKVIAVGDLFLVMSSTPRGKTGHYYRTYKDIQNSIRLGIPSKWSYHEVPWWDCPRLKEDMVRALCDTDEEYQMEFCIQFLDELMTLFPFGLLDDPMVSRDITQYSLASPPPLASDRVRFLGVDFGRKDSETAIVLAEKTPGKKKIMIQEVVGDEVYHREVEEHIWFIRFIKTLNDVPSPQQQDIIMDCYQKFRPTRVYCDKTSFGLPMVEMLEQPHMIGPSTVEGVNFTNESKEKMIYNLKNMLEARILIIPKHEKLKKQLHATHAEPTPSGKRKFTGKGAGNDDLVWALALAVSERIAKGVVSLRSAPFKNQQQKKVERDWDKLLREIREDPFPQRGRQQKYPKRYGKRF